MLKWFFILGFVFAFFATQGQSAYRFSNFSINEGLSQSSVTCILQDENHALWIGTQDGLNRFDGKQFEVFSSDESDGLKSEYIKCGIKTDDGRLWFGTANGLSVFDPRTEHFKHYTLPGKIALQIEGVCKDQKGILWLATSGKGIISFNPRTSKFTEHPKLTSSRRIRGVYNAQDDGIFVVTEDKGVFITDAEKSRCKPLTLPVSGALNGVQRIVTTDKGFTYFCTSQGVYTYTYGSQSFVPTFTSISTQWGVISVTDLVQTNDGTTYIVTSGQGLYTVYPNGEIAKSAHDLLQKNALLFNDINVLFLDDAGTFWAGTKRGLSGFDPTTQGFLGIGPSADLTQGIPKPNVWSFGEDKKGNYLFVGTDIGISRRNRSTGAFEQFYRSDINTEVGGGDETAVLSMYVIDQNRILAGCADGLFELLINPNGGYSFKQLELQSKNILQRHNRVYSIVHWKDQQYFLGTKLGALLIDLKTKEVKAFEHRAKHPKESITSGVCRVVYKDSEGKIWFATSSGELSVLSIRKGKPSIRPYEHNALFLRASKDYISSICQTGPHEYWFGTIGSGLMKWNDQTKKLDVFQKKQGLPNNVVYGVLKAGDKHLWLSTNKGLCRFDMYGSKCVNYTERDGLMSNEFNIGAYLKSKNGELYFGGIYGYNFFWPEKLSLKSKDVRVKIVKFKLDKGWLLPGDAASPLKQPISQTDLITLRYRQRSFSVRFQPSNLSHPDLINYKYILEGADEGEMLIGSSNELRFSSLSPGTYVLKIYARIGEGPWSSTPAMLSIEIKSPFWATWWFIAIICVVLAVAIRIFVRERINSARRDQVRLEMKIADRTREIRAQNEKIENQRKQLELEKNKVIEQQRLLQIEKDKSEKLLKNIIPESTAEELKNLGRASARAYKTVSVLFTDFVGFTKAAERMSPTELVSKLDVYFRKFDEIIVANGLEKIKTIGDAYMCAGGVPVRNLTNPVDTCLAALQIQHYMATLKYNAIAHNQEYWELRLGINTGEVTAGVIGSERLAYDIWGSTVNQAQRMEMLGEPGKVTISGNTFKYIEPYFECTFRGKAQSKSKGLIDMYTVDRIKPELSINGEGVLPNERFHQIVNLHHFSSINYYKAERHIIRVLEQGLSEKLHYHSIDHSIDVVKAVERLALLEGITDEGLFLLKTAATYHDAGFVEQYDKNEPIGARLAEEILPKYGYTEQHINTIKELIYVTQIPHKPKNKLEEIMCDADLDYLGRDDFHEIADRLRRELREHGKIDSDRKWDEIQIQFLTAHRYFTDTAINTRQEKKLENIQEIRDRLERDEYDD
jgi:ligand-binding sensor domain-containing protein/class 3 adenylate cyclase/predicted metal-dependent HD superfamily phosphohydrolase